LLVRTATRDDVETLKPVFRAAFGSELNEPDWLWKYHENPHAAVSVIACEETRALGFYGGWATRYRGEEGDLPGVSATDVMTRPDTRALGRRGLFRAIGEAYCRLNADAGIPFFFGFPNERHRIVGERILGYWSVEPTGQLRRALPLEPAARGILPRLRGRGVRVARVPDVGAGHDALAEALHARAGWRTDRSRRTVSWRFARRPGGFYAIYEAADSRGASVGFAAVRRVLERALLVDLQLLDERSGALGDLLRFAAEDQAASGAGALAIRCPREGWLSRRLREEFAFEPEPTDAHFEVRLLRPPFDLERAAPLFDYRYADHDVF